MGVRKGAPEPNCSSGSEQTGKENRELCGLYSDCERPLHSAQREGKRDSEADDPGYPGQMLPDRHGPFQQNLQTYVQVRQSSMCKSDSPFCSSHTSLFFWHSPQQVTGKHNQTGQLTGFPLSGSGLPDRAQVPLPALINRSRPLLPSSPFLAVLDSAFG